MAAYDSILDFTRKILKNFNITSCVLRGASLADFALKGPLQQLMEFYDYRTALEVFLKQCKEHTVYFSQDCFFCRYTVMKLPGQEPPLYFLAGPYSFHRPDSRFLLNIQQKFSIPAEHAALLRHGYQAVPFIEFEDYLRSTLLLLAAEIYGGEENFSIVFCDGLLEALKDFHYIPSDQKTDDHQLIEERYRQEKELMMAVSSGNYEKTELMIAKITPFKYEQRLPNQLRDKKNYLIILNTLMRKAAESGGVHPVYLDDISSQFAHKIEIITSDWERSCLIREMLRKYCMLVRSYSTKGYPPIIQKAMNYLPMHLEEDLSLKAMAAECCVSPTYLSALFKKESGSTLTEYVNRKRVEQALFLLNSTDLHIQTIAASCGIPDLNYFTKVFKKQTGKTPSEYRAMIHQNFSSST